MFESVDIHQLKRWIDAGEALVVDIRDPGSFAAGHVPGAQMLGQDSIDAFLRDTPRASRVVVCCYHGISSQHAAMYLVEQGFTCVYSLDGGFEGWRWSYPVAADD